MPTSEKLRPVSRTTDQNKTQTQFSPSHPKTRGYGHPGTAKPLVGSPIKTRKRTQFRLQLPEVLRPGGTLKLVWGWYFSPVQTSLNRPPAGNPSDIPTYRQSSCQVSRIRLSFLWQDILTPSTPHLLARQHILSCVVLY